MKGFFVPACWCDILTSTQLVDDSILNIAFLVHLIDYTYYLCIQHICIFMYVLNIVQFKFNTIYCIMAV